MSLTLIHGIKQIARVAKNGENFKTMGAMDDVELMEADSEAGLSIIIDKEGRICDFGDLGNLKSQWRNDETKKVIDARGGCVVPGFVDAHTHPVWAGDRVNEFSMKLSGASYMEIHEAGGGIHFTVEKTRNESEKNLVDSLVSRLNKMSKKGTTLVECKSGYGLDIETERKMLTVLEKARPIVNLGISSTYCGAHAIPKGKTSDEATEMVINELPMLKAMNDEKKLQVDSVDVFCEKGVFSVEQTRRILEAARKHGFLLNFHAEELNYIGGVEMGASLQAEAMSHLEEISDKGIEAMASTGSVAVILPTTAFILRLTPPPARKLIDAGVPVALGTDFNPNAHCMSMPLVMFLACIEMKLTLNEALVASTLNAAHSIRKSNTTGSIEQGKWADFLIINAPRWEHIIYQVGNEEDLISHVFHHGKIVKST